MRQWIIAGLLAIGTAAATADTAEAQLGFSYGYGSYSSGYYGYSAPGHYGYGYPVGGYYGAPGHVGYPYYGYGYGVPAYGYGYNTLSPGYSSYYDRDRSYGVRRLGGVYGTYGWRW